MLPTILPQERQMDASADQSEKIHMELFAYMDDFLSEVCRRLGILDFQEAVSMQRFRSAARLVNAALSLSLSLSDGALAVRCRASLERRFGS